MISTVMGGVRNYQHSDGEEYVIISIVMGRNSPLEGGHTS